MHQIFSQIELAILKEKEEREKDLKTRLNKKRITTRGYEQRVRDLDKWVADQRKDIQDRKTDYDFRNVSNLISDIRQDHKFDKKTNSPKQSRQSMAHSEPLEENSRDSDEVKEAIR